MRKLNYLFNLFLLLSLSVGIISCGDDEPVIINEFERGVFVVNEGNFGEGDGSISYFNPSTEEVKFNVFSQNNDEQPLGDVVQSMTIDGITGYIVVNNSNKIEVVNAKTMEGIGTIENVSLPRYMVLHNDRGFVTEWVSFSDPGRVAVINPGDNSVTKTIQVGFGAEYLLIKDNKLYVSNSFENTVSVIDLTSEAVIETIIVSSAPKFIKEDVNGKLWVICSGGYNADWSPANDGALVKIDPTTDIVEETLEFGANVNGKMALNPSQDRIYYSLGNAIYGFDIASASLPTTPLITNDDIIGVYGLGVDPSNGNIYIADNAGFQSNGFVFRFQPDGTFIDSFEAGRGPNGFAFIP
ncbi:MAG: DUF5074 domain-containing protein [Candidatus Cyclobacteriaceae bacterium M2_1C_046]